VTEQRVPVWKIPIMRILLISSFTPGEISRKDISPPLSLLYVAAVLRANGHEVTLLDLTPIPVPPEVEREQFYIERIIETFDRVNPDLVGQNCFQSTHFSFVRRVAREVKSKNISVPFVIGGIHPTLFAREIIENCPEIDYVILGEGEVQIKELTDALSKGKKNAINGIPSIAYRDDSGLPVVTQRQGYIKDLDSIPMPAWDLVRVEDYYTDHSNWYNPRGLDIKMSVPILTSRSCPFDCNFCSAHSMMGRGLRMHSPGRVVDEMEKLYRDYGLNYFGFVDDNLTLNKKHIMSICNEIVRRGMNIQFESFNGYNVASMDEEIVEAMSNAGCVYVIMPIEHGSDYIRNKIIGKNLPRNKIYELAEIYKKYNLLTRGVFIMGFPEDTRETLNETYKMMQGLQLDLYNVFTLIPFPGTRIYEQARRDNLFINEVDADRMWDGESGLSTLDNQIFIKPYNMTIDELLEFREKFDKMRLNSNRVKELQKKSN